ANTPIYARRRRTENLRQAVTLLGFDVVLTASLSLTLTAGRTGSQTRSPRFRKRRWTRSVHSAACAQLLAERVRFVDPTDAFLAALLQDIGVQVVDRLEPAIYDECDPNGSHEDLVAAELATLGADHAEVGAILLHEWRLPPTIVNAVRFSHDARHSDATSMAGVCAVAGFIADGFAGHGAAFDRALVGAERLGISTSTFATILEYTAMVLPDLASILDAETPDQETLTELAEEAIVMRQLHAQTTASQLSDEVESLRNEAEDLRTQNGLDELTGLANRRRLDEILETEFTTARRNGFPLSILFVDLDDFKLVNDRFGHNVGDQLLTASARRISAAVRDGDFVGRFGGEEFIVVLPGGDRADSDAVAARVIQSFTERTFDLPDGMSLSATASAGVSTCDERTAFETVAEFLHAADLALYVAKRNGKRQFRRSDDDALASPQPEHSYVPDRIDAVEAKA
ncbi:MAG: diguanylate cyclase, partial [Actinomycetota bacterium]